MKNTIILGTRGSKLALIQTEIVAKKLQKFFPEIKTEVKIIKTTGDKNMSPVPLDSVGKDWFTKELDKALLDGTIDAAVHSLKDISETLPKDLIIAAIPDREDAREAFISRGGVLFKNIKKGALIGTDSTRRKAQLLHKRPDIRVESIRGNVNRRLEKLETGEYDGIFLAVAGLKRLDLESQITEYFSETDIIPSPGQGALAVVIKKNNAKLFKMLKKLNQQPTVIVVKAERAFSKVFGGGCSMPIGAYAVYKKDKMILYGMVASLDGKHVLKDSLEGSSSSPVALGRKLGIKMIKESAALFHIKERSCVIITNPQKEKSYLAQNVKKLGLQPFIYPTITIKKLPVTKEIKKYISEVDSFNWIIFTSKNSVKYFIDITTKMKISTTDINRVKIAAVGKKTYEELKKFNLTASFTPSHFTSIDLVKEIENIKNKKILLPRGNLASSEIKKKLEKKGAEVVEVILYKTEFASSPSKEITNLLKKNNPLYLTFTSPSTVKGFLKNIQNKNMYAVPTISIGPTTTEELIKSGFRVIHTADVFTEEGMIIKLKEILV